MIQALLGYLLNAVWQAPLAAAGALALSRMARLSQRVRCLVFAGFLGLAVVLPAIHLQVQEVHPKVGRTHPAEVLGPLAISNAPLQTLERTRSVEAAIPVRSSAAVLLVAAALLLMVGGAARLLIGVHAARGLARRARPFALSSELADRLQAFTHRSRLPLPAIRQTSEIASPVVVGAWPAGDPGARRFRPA